MHPVHRSLSFRAIALFLLAAPPLAAQNWFQPSLLSRPTVVKAMESIDARSSAIVDEWIRLVEIQSPSRKEQARALYIRAEMEKLGLADIRTDDMYASVTSVRPMRPVMGSGRLMKRSTSIAPARPRIAQCAPCSI